MMQKVIRKKTYDTETARLAGVYTVSYYGDPAGYEERLYETPDGFYFLYGVGGADSLYKEETIRPLSKANAEKWQALHG